MSDIKVINKPDFKSAVRLTPLQLNSLRLQKKHTLLSPARLEDLAGASAEKASS